MRFQPPTTTPRGGHILAPASVIGITPRNRRVPHDNNDLYIVLSCDASRQAHAGVVVRGRLPRLRRRVDRQRRASLDPPRPALLSSELGLGSQRLPVDLRRGHAPRRPPPAPPRAGPRA